MPGQITDLIEAGHKLRAAQLAQQQQAKDIAADLAAERKPPRRPLAAGELTQPEQQQP